jgi:REP element-mobilizing transposase RayT
VCPAKYRWIVISPAVDKTLRETCEEIEKRYGIKFVETGTEGDHVHFLVQSVPSHSPTKIVTTIKSILAREIRGKHPEIKEKLWGGEFWSDGYYVSTVSRYRNEEVIKNYVKNQGTEKKYAEICKKQLELFD